MHFANILPVTPHVNESADQKNPNDEMSDYYLSLLYGNLLSDARTLRVMGVDDASSRSC